jgi:acyl-CoA hydrolase
MNLASLLQPGDRLIAGQTLGEPTALLATLFSAAEDVDDLSLFTGMSLTGIFAEAPSGMDLTTFVGLGTSGRLIAEGRMRLIPCHMSELAWSLREGPLRPDVALVLVSPPDAHGMCSLGVSSDYIWNAFGEARVVLAEVNSQVPHVAGDTTIPFERIDGLVESDRPLPEQPK